MLKLMDKKIIAFLRLNFLLYCSYDFTVNIKISRYNMKLRRMSKMSRTNIFAKKNTDF